jgi:putative IMPACT (imprinted ancient) family translation regulator
MDELVRQAASMIELKQRRLNEVSEHYQILDTLITAAKTNDEALLVARYKTKAGRNKDAEFRRMAAKLTKEQLIKLLADLKLINFLVIEYSCKYAYLTPSKSIH